MTRQFEQLKERPRMDINIGRLNNKERQLLRKIDVRGTQGLTQSNLTGPFNDVYYLEGDEQAAAAVFVEENSTLLDAVDFSKRNILQTSLDRPVYDWILHELGERVLEKYETVVHETRSDGSVWIIDQQRFENHADRRYAKNNLGTAFVPADVSLKDVFAEGGPVITEADLKETDLEGDVRQVLDFFRQNPDFPCQPVSVDGMLAVRKSESAAG
ncbi:hypothetical protein [Halorarum salinum]|uniref:Uncharacterized protein n=1 Tax=Halorarum salinum TaxID=2743089 RepID=A0A7D5LBW0_9EURY|nr:hypothetical protein [Halobaculum salinum]QLG63073.1 hypothetical protein HUG12_15570 [Halobaculum salinum]